MVGADNQKKKVKLSRQMRQYLSYTELQQQVQALGIKSATEYRTVDIKKFWRHLHHPERVYEEWENWNSFLGTNLGQRQKKKRNYLSYTELQQKVQALGIKSVTEYRRRYKEISEAPSHPEQVYEEWLGWSAFCGRTKNTISSLHRIKRSSTGSRYQRSVVNTEEDIKKFLGAPSSS